MFVMFSDIRLVVIGNEWWFLLQVTVVAVVCGYYWWLVMLCWCLMVFSEAVVGVGGG